MINANYIRTSFEKILSENIERYLFNRILVYQKDPLPKNIDLNLVISEIENKIPQHLLDEVDDIFIGDFKEFTDRNINAFYKDGAIFVTNKQSSTDDLLDDIVHEIAHAVEEKLGLELYSDGNIEEEFLYKRKVFYFRLVKHVHIRTVPKYSVFQNSEYNLEFDEYLYKTLGYDKIRSFMSDTFSTMYSLTSLEEYFAEGFKELFLDQNVVILKKMCPRLYEKLTELIDLGDQKRMKIDITETPEHIIVTVELPILDKDLSKAVRVRLNSQELYVILQEKGYVPGLLKSGNTLRNKCTRIGTFVYENLKVLPNALKELPINKPAKRTRKTKTSTKRVRSES